jgi:hypothetical protein
MNTGFRFANTIRTEMAESPLFERQLGDDYAELQHYKILSEQQQQRIILLENISVDLENRLEKQAKLSNAIEAECNKIERSWSLRCQQLEAEITHWKHECQKAQQRGAQIREQLSRTEKELYVILQRSYELRRGPALPGNGSTAGAGPSTGSGRIGAPIDISQNSNSQNNNGVIRRADTSSSDLDSLYQVAKVRFW